MSSFVQTPDYQYSSWIYLLVLLLTVIAFSYSSSGVFSWKEPERKLVDVHILYFVSNRLFSLCALNAMFAKYPKSKQVSCSFQTETGSSASVSLFSLLEVCPCLVPCLSLPQWRKSSISGGLSQSTDWNFRIIVRFWRFLCFVVPLFHKFPFWNLVNI